MRRALVTGGSGSIGSAICRQLAREGLEVVVHANRNCEAAEALADAIRAEGRQASAICFDVTDATATRSALDSVLASGPVQVLVNNAGLHHDGLFATMEPARWHEVVDVSLDGFFNVTQPLTIPMMGSRWGRIINISSVSALLGNMGQVNYSAAKAALHGATKALAREVGSRGITVNAVAPGVIETPATQAAFTPQVIKQLVPMRRAGTAQEVADLVAFLASDKAGYISGQVIAVSGAMV